MIVEEDTGKFLFDKIKGVNYTDVFNQYRGRNFKEVYCPPSSSFAGRGSAGFKCLRIQ